MSPSRRLAVLQSMLSALALLGTAACDQSSPRPPLAGPAPVVPVERLELTGPPTIAPGERVQFRLLAISPNGSSRDVSAQAEWRSSNTDVLTLDVSGLAEAKNPGEATVRAVYESRPTAATVIVVPSGTYAVTGTVREMLSGAAIAGARVQAVMGSPILETTSDSSGQFGLYGVPAGAELRVSKDGFAPDVRSLQISAHLVVSVYLSSYNLSGTYTMTLDTGAACGFPEEVRRRTYTAVLEEKSKPSPNTYLVTLKDGTFLEGCGDNVLVPGLRCNQFLTWRDGDEFRVGMMDLDWGLGGQIVERLSNGTWLFVVGWPRGRIDGSTIETVGTADEQYCPEATDSPLKCRTTYCRSNEFRLTFRRH